MKKTIQFLLLAFTAIIFFASCMKDKITSTYTSFEPIYENKTTVLQNIKSTSPQPMQQTGKIALYGNYIFLNELDKGVHIIDNSNPAAPQNIAFIAIPGNIDIAVKNNILYADIFTDMVAIDISNPNNAVFKKVTYNVFPERLYSSGFNPDETRYIIGWVKHETDIAEEITQNKSLVQIGVWSDAQFGGPTRLTPVNFTSGTTAATSSSSGGTSVNGSMARFAVVNNYLYTVGQSSLSSYNVTDASNPIFENTLTPGWNIETIFPLNDKLFIGSQTGMFIYSITNPASPTFLSSFSHACFDDPVIANDHYAFVTLRAMTGTSTCWGTAPQRNELDIIDINNITSPTLVKIYDMEEPQGLSLDGNTLFICDGKGGLKIYDAVDVNNLRLLNNITNINPFDVIAYNGIALVVSTEGISQYDYTDINNVRKLSTINTHN